MTEKDIRPDSHNTGIALPTLQDRWAGVNTAWFAYQASPEDSNTFVEFLISLDSFINHANDNNFEHVVEAGREAMLFVETLPDQDTPNMTKAELIMQRVTELVASVPVGTVYKNPIAKPTDEPRNQSVVLYWPDTDESSDISAQMEHYGYIANTQPSVSKAAQYAITKNAAMFVVDISREPLELIKPAIAELTQAGLPWTAVTDNGDFQERLELVRMNVASVLSKPVTAATIVDAIDRNTRSSQEETYRVLVVDDSTIVHHFVEQTLGAHGIETLVLSDVSQVLTAMHDFFPDLLLLDLRLPECSGLEVARIIRQHESFLSIPIVYLSGETNRQIQLEAIRLGGDEFLVKPVQPEQLLTTVVSKIERYRMLRRYMVQDGLTGLLNHTRIKQHLLQAVLLAKRDHQPISFAMLDIDNFKKVNDTYGHPVGDRVIKSLAKLLRQRVRKSDVVGRYGGEEFAIILHGARPDDAFRIMDRIRKDFATVYHPYENGIFGATFSCGISGFPSYDDPNVIAARADIALYEAKRNGKNQVVVHNPASKTA